MSDQKGEENIYDRIRADLEKQIAERKAEERERQRMLEDWHGTEAFADRWNNPGGNK